MCPQRAAALRLSTALVQSALAVVIRSANVRARIPRRRYGERSDIWGLGCVLYEAICLQHPFAECTTIEQLRQKARHVLPSLRPVTATDARQPAFVSHPFIMSFPPLARPATGVLRVHPSDSTRAVQPRDTQARDEYAHGPSRHAVRAPMLLRALLPAASPSQLPRPQRFNSTVMWSHGD